MAKITVGPLQDFLEPEELESIQTALQEAEVLDLGVEEDCPSTSVASDLDEDSLVDFGDQLDANDAACDLYLPISMEEIVKVDGRRIGSVFQLITALEELASEIGVVEERMDEFDEMALEEDLEEDDGYIGETDDWHNARAAVIWKALLEAANLAVENHGAIFVQR